MKKLAPDAGRTCKGSAYPAPFDQACRDRVRRAVGDVAGLTDFGVNVLRLPPGAWSSQRHWHSHEDEFTWVLHGQVVLVTDEGERREGQDTVQYSDIDPFYGADGIERHKDGTPY